MGKQQAGFYPASYALWYEHAAGVNPTLSQVLDRRLAAHQPLTDADVLQLYAKHIVSRDAEAIGRIQQRLSALMKETSEIVSQTGTHAMLFGESLEGHTQRLKQPASLEALHRIVGDLLSETQQMCAANVTLVKQLDTSAKEVITLTHRLERVQAEALNDPLTGLLNRRGFEKAVVELHEKHAQLRGAALLVADIDQFKLINDSHGHLVGDQVLRAVAQVLRARIKGADIAARLGGDEFAVLLPDTALPGAMALAEQIRTTLLQDRLRVGERNEHVENITLSVGVAHAGNGAAFEVLLERADAALYTAKRAGRNRVSTAPAPGSDSNP